MQLFAAGLARFEAKVGFWFLGGPQFPEVQADAESRVGVGCGSVLAGPAGNSWHGFDNVDGSVFRLPDWRPGVPYGTDPDEKESHGDTARTRQADEAACPTPARSSCRAALVAEALPVVPLPPDVSVSVSRCDPSEEQMRAAEERRRERVVKQEETQSRKREPRRSRRQGAGTVDMASEAGADTAGPVAAKADTHPARYNPDPGKTWGHLRTPGTCLELDTVSVRGDGNGFRSFSLLLSLNRGG